LKILFASIAVVLMTGCASPDAQRSESIIETKAQVAALGVLANITALEMLQRGDRADAMDFLDRALDVNVAILIETPLAENVPGRDKYLTRAAEYRAKYPRAPPSRVDLYLQEYFRSKKQEGK
jgi:hypothetical protein